MPTREEVIDQFKKDMWDVYNEPAKRPRPYKYIAHYYRKLLEDYREIGTAVMLIDKEEVSSGLIELDRIGMLHCSVEAIILKPKYRIPDFEPTTPERREKARRRLRDNFNYTAPWDTGE